MVINFLLELYGRGYSDSPGVVYDDVLFVNQLVGLLLKLGWDKPSIIGYSLGGAIATGYISRFPESIDKVVYIAPAGIMEVLANLIRNSHRYLMS